MSEIADVPDDASEAVTTLRTAAEIEAERLNFKRARLGHNGTGVNRTPSRITYVAHGKGYVMARHPGCMPFAITETLWLSFPLWNDGAELASGVPNVHENT